MKIFGDKLYIKAACFLAAFAAVGAGFAYLSHRFEVRFYDREKAYEELTLTDSAENLEKLSTSLSTLESIPEDKRSACLSDIRLYAELAKNSLGYINFEEIGGNELFSFLSGVSILAENALQLGISGESAGIDDSIFPKESAPSLQVFTSLSNYAHRISNDALPLIETDKVAFEAKLSEIFSDTVLETILYENGYGALAPDNGFSTIGGGVIDEKDAIKTARKHLGAKAQLKAHLTAAEPAFYHIEGKNISAIVSAKSGYLMQFLFDLPHGEIKIDEETAKAKAESFLLELGFDPSENGILGAGHSGELYIFEYIPVTKNNVLCLSEKIIVGVSHGSGRICLFDATNYYRYHDKHLNIPSGTLSPEEVASQYALAENPQLCKIERTKGIESLCYSFVRDGNTIFISALSGMMINE